MLRTTVNVTCAESGNITPYTGIVVGRILNTPALYTNGVASGVAVNFQYEKPDGTLLYSNVVTKDTAETNSFYNLIASDLPPFVNYLDNQNNIFYKAFQIEMALTFGIPESDIETFNPVEEEVVSE